MSEKSEFLKNVGQKLRAHRLRSKLSLDDVAVNAGITSSFLEEIEKGNCDFDLILLFAICKQYKVDAWEVVGD